jgi:hypothetical protein
VIAGIGSIVVKKKWSEERFRKVNTAGVGELAVYPGFGREMGG